MYGKTSATITGIAESTRIVSGQSTINEQAVVLLFFQILYKIWERDNKSCFPIIKTVVLICSV